MGKGGRYGSRGIRCIARQKKEEIATSGMRSSTPLDADEED